MIVKINEHTINTVDQLPVLEKYLKRIGIECDMLFDSGINQLEIFNEKIGFNVTTHSSDGFIRHFNNVTEIHLAYKTPNGYALESDIHCSGFCPYEPKTVLLEFKIADEIYENF